MSDTSAGHARGAGRYEIRLKGRLSSRWAARFDGMTLSHDGDGTTVLHRPVVDQAALHGLPLLSVTQVEPDQPTGPTSEPR
jgi:hypothetical protein